MIVITAVVTTRRQKDEHNQCLKMFFLKLKQKWRTKMPYINVKLAGSINKEQKAEIAKEITDTMSRIANKPASYTYVVFDEVATEDWAIGGNLLG